MGGWVWKNLHGALFDLPGDLVSLLKAQLDAEGSQDEQEKAARQAAESVVTKFVQAWQDRSADGMTAQLTAGAKREFSPGILEDSSDIASFRIITTTVEDRVKATIAGQLTKQTPDGATNTEGWQFIVLKGTTDSWLIDKWQQP